MNQPTRALAIVAAVIVLAAAAPTRSVKTATLACTPGWRGQAVGQYGGVGFSVACNNGRGTDRIVGPVGTAYAMRMGVESDTGAADCAFSGDSPTVDVSCAQVRLTIR